MKKKYFFPTMEVYKFDEEDIVTASIKDDNASETLGTEWDDLFSGQQ